MSDNKELQATVPETNGVIAVKNDLEGFEQAQEEFNPYMERPQDDLNPYVQDPE